MFPNTLNTHCKVSRKFHLPLPTLPDHLKHMLPVATTPCRIPLDDWQVCHADACYLNARCPAYAGTAPQFEPKLPLLDSNTGRHQRRPHCSGFHLVPEWELEAETDDEFTTR